MNLNPNLLQNRYGLIIKIAEAQSGRYAGASPQSTVQELIYLMQELYQLPTEYKFELLTLGPYCHELSEDLIYLDAIHGIIINFFKGKVVYLDTIHGLPSKFSEDETTYKTYPGKYADSFTEKASKFLTHHAKAIEEILYRFGKKPTKEIRATASLVYTLKYNPENGKALLNKLKASLGEETLASILIELAVYAIAGEVAK